MGVVHPLVKTLCFLKAVQVTAVQVLFQRHYFCLVICAGNDDTGNLGVPAQSGRTQTAFTGDQFVFHRSDLADGDWLQDTVMLDALCQFLKALFVVILAGSRAAWTDLHQWDLDNFSDSLEIQYHVNYPFLTTIIAYLTKNECRILVGTTKMLPGKFSTNARFLVENFPKMLAAGEESFLFGKKPSPFHEKGEGF